MKTRLPCVLLSAGLLLAALPMSAQQEPHYAWVTFGVGESTTNISCTGVGCESGWRHHGSMLVLDGGLMFSPHLGAGLAWEVWSRGPADSISTSTQVVELRYDPSSHVGPYFEAGVGISRAEVGLSTDTVSGHNGMAFLAGVGYDIRAIRLKKNGAALIVTPRLSYVYSSIGTLQSGPGRPPYATRWRHQVLSLGVGFGVGFFNLSEKS